MGGIIIKRKIRLERENKSRRIFIKSIWLVSARHEVERSALQEKRWCWTGGVLFNSASEDCMHFWFDLHVRHIHLFWVHKCEKRGGENVKSIGGYLTFSRVHPRICCTRPLASNKPLSIQWSMHLWWGCFPNPFLWDDIGNMGVKTITSR